MEVLRPVTALAAWTMVMWVWMYATRLPAMRAAKIRPDDLVQGPKKSLDDFLPPHVQWKAHNYNHLHEQPTIFYALMFFVALTGGGDGTALSIAWAYVASRVLHSLVQATINRVVVRFALFVAGSLALMAMAARELVRVFGT